jgi:2-polyprenyl-3-methyl-5-hydroxy-6-metoxy-1,4-benzoquinol methylase
MASFPTLGMMRDYLVVGPRLELAGRAHAPASVCFGVARRGTLLGATVSASVTEVAVEVALTDDRAALSPDDVTEALRLCARVAERLERSLPLRMRVPVQVSLPLETDLGRDGFLRAADRLWERPAGPFVRAQEDRAHRMDDVYADYFTVPWNFVPREFDVLDAVLEDPGLQRSQVLDAGCGFGKNSLVMEPRCKALWGVDISQRAIARCRELVRSPHRFVVASAHALPWPARFFDRIVDIGCLHCLPTGCEDAVAEFARVLAPKGVLYLRAFKPRDVAWCAAQPFHCEHLGFDERALQALLSPHFDVTSWRTDSSIHYLKCVR